MGTLRDALVAAISLDTFNRHAEKVDMANVAQLINNLHSLFLADGDKFVATPTFHVYTMYRPHQGARAVRIDVEAPEVTFQAGGRSERIFRLAGSASRSGNERRDADAGPSPRDRAGGGRHPPARRRGRQVRHTVLTHAELNAHNTFERPDVVTPKTSTLEARGAELRCKLPAASVNALEIRLA